MNRLIAADGQEIRIAGNDEIGLGGKGGGDDLVVIGIAPHHARHGERLDDPESNLECRILPASLRDALWFS